MKKQTTRQRIEQAVAKVGAVTGSYGFKLLDKDKVVKLILAERRRIRDQVLERKRKAKVRPMGFERLDGYLMACDDMLARLRG